MHFTVQEYFGLHETVSSAIVTTLLLVVVVGMKRRVDRRGSTGNVKASFLTVSENNIMKETYFSKLYITQNYTHTHTHTQRSVGSSEHAISTSNWPLPTKHTQKIYRRISMPSTAFETAIAEIK